MISQVQKSILGSLLTIVAHGMVGNTIAFAGNQPPLQGTPWQLQSWSDAPSLVPDTPITLSFEQSNLTGSGGCNRYRMSYQVNKQSLKINSAIASTRKAFPEEIMSQEAQYLAVLTMVEGFEINEQGQLKLTYRTKKGTGTLIFVDAERATFSSPSKKWLDEKNLTNWNQPGISIPQAPKPQADTNLMKRCQDGVRPPTTPEDVSLSRNGWMLFGPAQLYSGTSLVTAASDFDGMCRPLKYQAFIFVDGRFAGTLSPQLMDSRTDSSSQPIFLYGASNINAEFKRYSEKDALCCPSAVSRVSYQIQRKNDLPVVVPIEVVTQKLNNQ